MGQIDINGAHCFDDAEAKMENKISDEILKQISEGEFIDLLSSHWNHTRVLFALVTQLRDAGYTGTLSEMVGQACALQEAARWIPVEERLPETKQDILVIVKNKKPRVEKACYIPPKTILAEDFLSDECDCESVQEYDEENDSYWVVEGWWESSWESDANWKLSGEVTHWMPLPVPPEGEK
jgi:hypothetical protein